MISSVADSHTLWQPGIDGGRVTVADVTSVEHKEWLILLQKGPPHLIATPTALTTYRPHRVVANKIPGFHLPTISCEQYLAVSLFSTYCLNRGA